MNPKRRDDNELAFHFRDAFEFLLVLVIIGGVFGILIVDWPDFYARKVRKRYISAMKSDLENAVSAAEWFFADNNTYAGFTAPTGSVGVTMTVSNLSNTGYTISATHRRASGAICHVGVGTGTPADLLEGQPGGTNCR